ncbi:putative arabinan endo-1,5-alpha-L-arabinosidase [Lachnellula hyalina]|uniref:Putative arabinan endo-1,5-alpha-L-arabinosidase n=1 Tax=Lachnellula hyalina TaxID=1316788 RepID=A0A8H8R5S6_9HELO|nr:putative arabinan endo-1,5-alpha-L-arabinosidase [Lachnellula hyalina]TVY29053.1 putative arabinan endo-1,5-alpha-L-arabinosidase [Lachnellula hyalina]
MLSALFSTAFLLIGFIAASPFEASHKRSIQSIDAVIDASFADPAIFEDTDGTFYTFATSHYGIHVQVAMAMAVNGPWEVLPLDLLPTPGYWSTGARVWAPDVRKIGENYILYYSAQNAEQTAQHCVGAATSKNVLGPYEALDTPLACPLSEGGAIDISGFTDTDETHFVVYKVDGNSIGHGGACGNMVEPLVPTPIRLQRLEDDGYTPAGGYMDILDHIEGDGPYIEAPRIILVDGVYFLFFSSNCYLTPEYDVKYATASAIRGPYTRSSNQLLQTGMPFNLTAPGGAQITRDGNFMVFHANCDNGRCMYERQIRVSGTTVTIA